MIRRPETDDQAPTGPVVDPIESLPPEASPKDLARLEKAEGEERTKYRARYPQVVELGRAIEANVRAQGVETDIPVLVKLAAELVTLEAQRAAFDKSESAALRLLRSSREPVCQARLRGVYRQGQVLAAAVTQARLAFEAAAQAYASAAAGYEVSKSDATQYLEVRKTWPAFPPLDPPTGRLADLARRVDLFRVSRG